MPAETSEEIDTMSHSTDARRNHLATCRPQNQQCMKRMPRLHVRQELDQIVCAQPSKDVTVGANPTMRKIVCQCVCGLHLLGDNTFVLSAPSLTRGPPLPNLDDFKSLFDSAFTFAPGVVDAHELPLETNELPSSSQHSKSRPAMKWNHRGLRWWMPEWRIWHHC